MRNFHRNFKYMFSNFKQRQQTIEFLKGPIMKVLGINTALYLMWNLKGVSEQFLVKHFSYERFNIRENRYHTFVTHAFSHFGFFSFLFDSIIMISFGRQVVASHGNRAFWMLYLGGALAGGLFMQVFRPYNSIIIPEVGSGPALASLLTFYGVRNLHTPIVFFVIPMKMWVLLGIMGAFSLIEPSKKDLGGMLVGASLAFLL